MTEFQIKTLYMHRLQHFNIEQNLQIPLTN